MADPQLREPFLRYADTKDMAHFLDVATEMVTLLSSPSVPEPTATA